MNTNQPVACVALESHSRVFGFRFGDLPDFLLDHTLLGTEASGRIDEHWSRWCSLIDSLWRPNGEFAYELVYDFQPGSGGFQTSLLVKWQSRAPVEQPAAPLKSRFMDRLFKAGDAGKPEGPATPSEPATTCGEETDLRVIANNLQASLRAYGLDPFRIQKSEEIQSLLLLPNGRGETGEGGALSNWACCEVAQEELSLPVNIPDPSSAIKIPSQFIVAPPSSTRGSSFNSDSIPRHQDIYAIRPWEGPSGSFLLPFNTIVALNERVRVCVLLQPCKLERDELLLLAEMARQGESLSRYQTPAIEFGGRTCRPSETLSDTLLQSCAFTYSYLLRRLSRPHLCVALCMAAEQIVADHVAAALIGGLHDRARLSELSNTEQKLMPGATMTNVAPRLAQQVLSQMDITPLMSPGRNAIVPNPALKRLRFLADARGAANAFRFPLSVRGGVPGFVVKQRPPDFHPGPVPHSVEPVSNSACKYLDLGAFNLGGRARQPFKALTRHVFVTGFSGTGKTNTILYILHQLSQAEEHGIKDPDFPFRHIPFLVLESAKKEYRGLRHSGKLKCVNAKGIPLFRIFTLGAEAIAPIRLNPFQLLPGVRVESHIARLQTCFEAALPPVGPLPSIISEALFRVYRHRGWELTAAGPEESSDDPRLFPTVQELYQVVDKVLNDRGYRGDVGSNVRAAILGRLKPFLIGSKGLMFSQRRSQPSLSDLFTKPTVLELNEMNEQDKSLVALLVLTLLREYRETHPSHNQVAHVTVLEEAHNLLPDVKPVQVSEGGGSDVQAKAVQSICNMLSEIRALGEGIIIADQSPSKLARDAIRNTNIQIAHQLRDAVDRDAVASAMLMDEEQREFLGKIEPGKAAIFFTGLQKASFVTLPSFKDPPDPLNPARDIEQMWAGYEDCDSPSDSDREIQQHMRLLTPFRQTLPFACSRCAQTQVCQHHAAILVLAEKGGTLREFAGLLAPHKEKKEREKGEAEKAQMYLNLAGFALKYFPDLRKEEEDRAWCLVLHLWERCLGEPLSNAAMARKQFNAAFQLKVKPL